MVAQMTEQMTERHQNDQKNDYPDIPREWARAMGRAVDRRLVAREVARLDNAPRRFTVRSTKYAPGLDHQIDLDARGKIVSCLACPGFRPGQGIICHHAGAVAWKILVEHFGYRAARYMLDQALDRADEAAERVRPGYSVVKRGAPREPDAPIRDEGAPVESAPSSARNPFRTERMAS